MKALTISDVRNNFATVMDMVIDDAEECVIPRGGSRAVVIVSLEPAVGTQRHLAGPLADPRTRTRP